MVRSWLSAFGGVAGLVEAEIVVPAGVAALLGATGLDGVAAAGEICAGRLPGGGVIGGLGPKNLAHNRITTRERSEATTMRSSCVSLKPFCGSLKNAPRSD